MTCSQIPTSSIIYALNVVLPCTWFDHSELKVIWYRVKCDNSFQCMFTVVDLMSFDLFDISAGYYWRINERTLNFIILFELVCKMNDIWNKFQVVGACRLLIRLRNCSSYSQSEECVVVFSFFNLMHKGNFVWPDYVLFKYV